jgi:Fe-S cluster biogenesis protein NfuA
MTASNGITSPWSFANLFVIICAPKKPIVEKLPEYQQQELSAPGTDGNAPAPNFEPHELDGAIQNLLAEYVQPAVEGDGGSIIYQGFKDGTVTVMMRGSCAGCPSSTATLKGGIENLLKTHLPEVKEVVAAV